MQTECTNGVSQFLESLYAQPVIEGKDGKNSIYRIAAANSIRVLVDPYGGCHVEIPQNAEIPAKAKEEITKLSKYIAETKLFDSLWIDVAIPAKADILGICPASWEIGNPEKGNFIVDTQKNNLRVWQWLNAAKACAIPAGATHNLGATAAVIDETSQKILLVQNVGRKESWNMPGGSFEPGKDRPESTLSTAVRECKEEAGIDVSENDAFLIGQISFPFNQFAPAFNQVWKIVFNGSSTSKPAPQAGETLRAEWISFDDVKRGTFDGLKIGPEVQAAIGASQGFFKLAASKEWMQLYFTG